MYTESPNLQYRFLEDVSATPQWAELNYGLPLFGYQLNGLGTTLSPGCRLRSDHPYGNRAAVVEGIVRVSRNG